jgi:hypothetical protein
MFASKASQHTGAIDADCRYYNSLTGDTLSEQEYDLLNSDDQALSLPIDCPELQALCKSINDALKQFSKNLLNKLNKCEWRLASNEQLDSEKKAMIAKARGLAVTIATCNNLTGMELSQQIHQPFFQRVEIKIRAAAWQNDSTQLPTLGELLLASLSVEDCLAKLHAPLSSLDLMVPKTTVHHSHFSKFPKIQMISRQHLPPVTQTIPNQIGRLRKLLQALVKRIRQLLQTTKQVNDLPARSLTR